jgi:HEAT repeat protein
MSRFPWKDLLAQWSEEIIRSGDLDDELAPAVAASGWLGHPGATEEEISAAEARLGVTFPPSYREFLQVSNGWRMTTGFVRRLRPSNEVQWFAAEDRETVDAWMAGAGDEAVPDEEYLVYGDSAVQPLRAGYLQSALAISDYGDGIYLLNPQTVTPEGEWEAWFFAHWVPGADRYRSFWDMMVAEHDHFRYALKSSRGEATPRAAPSLDVDAGDLDALLAALQDPAQRPAALQVLGNLRDKRAFVPVLEVFQDRRADLFTRECAARTLGELCDPRAVAPLIDAFRTASVEITDMQFATLLRSGAGETSDATLDEMLGTVSIQDMINALEPLLGAAMTGHLRATLTAEAVGKGVSERLSYASYQGLLALGDVALPGLLDALQDADPGVRRQIATVLCHVRGRDGVFERLVVAFDDPDPSVRSSVAANIEQLFDSRAVDPLLKALEDAESTVRAHAARSLGIMATRSDAERIAKALGATSKRDPDAGVRRAASRALDRLGRT